MDMEADMGLRLIPCMGVGHTPHYLKIYIYMFIYII